MKQFNRFLGYFSLVLFLLLIVSIIVLITYTSINHNNWNSFINWNFNNLSFNISPISDEENGPRKLTIDDSKEFNVKDNIVINATFEDISFIKEDRDNILVEYYVKKPNSAIYKVDYSMDESDDTIYFKSSYTIQNITQTSGLEYNGQIKFYVPNDYVCDNLDINMSIGDINNYNLLDNVNNLSISANLGEVDLNITTPKENLSINCDLGNVDLTTESKIENLDISCNFGDLNLTTKQSIDSLYATADMGKIKIDALDAINYANLEANMGNITADFNKYINKLIANADLGSIKLNVYNNDDSTVYADSDIGNINSDLPRVNKSDDANFELYTNMGSIDVFTK